MNKMKLLRCIAYSLEILLAFLWQVTPGLLPEVYGGKAVLLVPVALTIAVFESDITAMVFGVVCGLLTDCSYSGPIGFYVILLTISCFVISSLYENYVRKCLMTAMLMAFAAIPVIFVLQFLFYYVFAGYPDGWTFFVRHYISRIIYTLAMTPVFYGLHRLIGTKLRQR